MTAYLVHFMNAHRHSVIDIGIRGQHTRNTSRALYKPVRMIYQVLLCTKYVRSMFRFGRKLQNSSSSLRLLCAARLLDGFLPRSSRGELIPSTRTYVHTGMI